MQRLGALLFFVLVVSALRKSSSTPNLLGNQLTCPSLNYAENWPNNAYNLRANRWNPQSQINSTNAQTLTFAWKFLVNSSVSTTPAYWGERLFFPAWDGNYYCVDARNGHLVWNVSGLGFSKTTPVAGADVVIFSTQMMDGGPRLYALNTTTGLQVWNKTLSNHKYAVITQSGTRVCNVLFVGISSYEELAPMYGDTCCTFLGTFFAIDTSNGVTLWSSLMTTPDFPGVAIWGSSPAIDLELGMIFITTGDTYDGPANVTLCMKTHPYEQCVPNTTFGDSIVALDLYCGTVKWFFRSWPGDWYNSNCTHGGCPRSPNPLDFDFAQGPMIFTTSSGRKLIGAGDKGGVFWALDAQEGQLVWHTRIGPGGVIGGLAWGSAVDDKRIYVALANSQYRSFTLPNNDDICYGAYAALGVDCGTLLWMVADPSGGAVNQTVCDSIASTGLAIFDPNIPRGATPIPLGPVTAAKGVVFGTTLNGYLYAFDATSGKVLWQFATPDNSSMMTGPTIIGNSIYFGTGYSLFGNPAIRPGTTFYSYKLR